MYASVNPAPTRTSSSTRRSRCSFVRCPSTVRRSGIVRGTRGSTTRATSSITSISRVTSRARQVGTVTSQSSLDLEAEPRQDRPLLVRGDLEADDAIRALGAEPDHGALGQAGVHVDTARQLGAGEVDEETAREHGGRLGGVRVDALLPAVRAFGAKAEPLGCPQDPDRLEVRCLEQHLGRLVGDLAVRAAHDRRERHGLRAVGDQQVARVERPQRAVERAQLLAGRRATNDDPTAVELRAVEGVQRASVDVHDVVRDVDDVRDRSHSRRVQAGAQPHRRRGDGDVL